MDSVVNLAFDWLMRHLPWCMLRCNRIYLHRRNGGLSMFVYQYFSIIFVLFRCFIYFTLNQLYRYTPFKVNETWCTHTETHFFCEIWMKLEENCFFQCMLLPFTLEAYWHISWQVHESACKNLWHQYLYLKQISSAE